MTTDETLKETQDQTGGLAESARRHIAYERLARQVAASEDAARLVLDALARKQRAAAEAAQARQITRRGDEEVTNNDAENNPGG